MNERKYPKSLFLMGFIMNYLYHFFWLFVPSIILLIVGFFIEGCRHVGLVLLLIDIIASFIEQMRIRKVMISESDNEQFRQFQDIVSKDGNVFENIRNYVEDKAEEYEDKGKDTDDLVMDMYNEICIKCEYGDAIEKLNEYERTFFVTQILEQEVNNGGFSQFFYNSSGEFANEIVDAFTKIGALKTAEICKKSLSVFNGVVPIDREERENLLEELECDDVLNECDDDFYNYEDDLEELNYAYIMQHKEFFDLKGY